MIEEAIKRQTQVSSERGIERPAKVAERDSSAEHSLDDADQFLETRAGTRVVPHNAPVAPNLERLIQDRLAQEDRYRRGR